MSTAHSTEQDALLEKVRLQVQACGLQEAILVDDQLDTEVTEARWIEAIGYLRTEDRPGFDNLRRFIAEKGDGNVEKLPTDDIRDEAVGMVAASASSTARETLAQVKFKERALEFLAGILRDVGLTPRCQTHVTPNDPPRDGKLYFLDYRMRGDDATAGIDAAELLKDIVERLPAHSPPPAAVLMSRGQNKRPTQTDWEHVAQEAGYYRFNFRYLGKEKLDGSKMPFLFFLHELLSSLPLGKEYYLQLKKLKEAAGAAADAALAKIRQLSPTEFSIFAGKHLGDGSGRRATRHVLELFLGLLDAEVKESESLESSFRAFAGMLKNTPMLATTDVDSHVLHNLHTKLLYDRSRWALQGPVEFGDIYQGSAPNVFYLVLTPECDLELRYSRTYGTWAPKAEDVLLLYGEVKNEAPDKTRGDVLGKPFVSDGSPRWIWWMMRKRIIVVTSDLSSDQPNPASAAELSDAPVAPPDQHQGASFKKWGRLRQLDAEEIQQRFVSDLASVGTDQVSGKVNTIPVEVWYRQAGQPDRKLGDLSIVEMPNPNDDDSPYWALGEGCESMLCSDGPPDLTLSIAELLELRHLQPRSLFIDRCNKKKLTVREGTQHFLIRSMKSVPRDWKPPAPTPPPPEEDP